MVFYIIIRGPAGSGKTTLAIKLAEIYNGKHINIDKVKKILGLRHSEAEKLAANEIVISEALHWLEKGKIVIMDEVLYYEKQLDQLESLPCQKYIFSLKAPLGECLQRNKKRRVSRGRKTTSNAIKLVYGLVSKIKKGIEIDTYNQSIDDSIKEIRSYLPE